MDIPRLAKILENKNDLVINEVVLNKAVKGNQIIYGARAFNLQSPDYLKKKTYDYDILTKRPKKAAEELAKELKRRLDKDFSVVKGRHKGTYRVKTNGQTIVDYTQITSKPETKKVWGTKVRSLESIKKNAKKLIKKPGLEYRREKDLDTLSRLKEIERIQSLF